MRNNYVSSSFYCMNCGCRGLTLPRTRAHQREKFHRKRLYCPTCRIDVNHIECRNDIEAYEFKEDFAAGVYKEEAQNSIDYIKNERWYK